MNNSNSTNSSSSFEDDLIAGGILIAFSISGILLHLVEMFAMGGLVRKVIGFRFFLVLSCADISLLFIFGIFPGWIILTKQPGFLTSWSRLLHTWADTCWFSMCYMNVFIALTRFACVVFPLEFRRLRRQSTCWLICAAIWLFALVQSWLMNSVPWFVVLWYDPSTYGFACDFEAYVSSGTRDLYLCLNLLIVAANLVIYISTALTIFFKRNLRFQFFSTILGQNASTKSVPSSPQEDPKMQHQVVQIQRSKAIVVIRTISVLRGSNGSNEGAASNFSVLANHSLEVRLVIPCCVNSIIFIIAQIIIINGGIGHGKWAGFSVMLIFCIQSIAPPILRFTFSEVLREEAMIMFGLKKSDKRRFRFWSVVASLISRH